MALTDKLSAIADAIRAKTGKTDSMTLEQMPTEIASITGGGGGSSGDSRVKYVTFMNGDTELIKYPVISGDTCRDPVVNGFISAPTKESTVQYNYTFYGWGASDGGAANANILKNITEDKTVYAIFTATAKLYTITWLDDDGSVLTTTQVAYGVIPSHSVTKEGYFFDSWTPTPVAVTGDATYTASWIETVTFATGSWADIARISEAGEARKYFNVGDTKVITMGGWGTQTLVILGFDHDDLADGSGKAGISIGMLTPIKTDSVVYNKDVATVPTELSGVIKKIKIRSHYKGEVLTQDDDRIHPFSWSEIGYPPYQNLDDGCTKYEYVPELQSDKIISCRGTKVAGSYSQGFYFYDGYTGLKDNALNGKYYFQGHFCV
jgi:uncharacterized repeat protein (TIGR02543 family)